MSAFGERLKEERKRLGLNQEDLARIGGVTRNTQGNYEKNERPPDSNYLGAIAACGVDVSYLLTGKRAAVDLSADESDIITIYRELADDSRGLIRRVISAMLVSELKKEMKGSD